MTHKASGGRALSTGALARVEGEGAMRIEIHDGQLRDVQLNIYEPPRFFEGFLRGRGVEEPVDITARICGICPVAYQMSACSALEDALGITVEEPIRQLRQLLYCGEWIGSHTLHIHFLHAPDFLGFESAIAMAEKHLSLLERGFQVKRIGNSIIELLGGRVIHPINVQVGGFYRTPTTTELIPLRGELERGRDLAAEIVEWVAGFDFPDQTMPYEFVSTDDAGEYPMLGNRITSDRGLDIGPAAFLDHVEEYQVPHSTALHAHLLARGEYLVGPLARFALHRSNLSPVASSLATLIGLEHPCRNPFMSIVVRALEVVHAFDIGISMIDEYVQPDAPAETFEHRAGTGHGVTEAPRGLLYNRFTIDETGRLTDAVIVPPTSQNQATIEHDLWHFVEDHLDLPDDELRRRAEMTIRNHDPCISCATHFLDLTVIRS